MSENEPEHIHLHSRTIGTLRLADDSVIVVEHVYEPEGTGRCEDCGAPSHDPGMVGLIVHEENSEPVSVLMAAEDALVLANRLTRAASLVLESAEDIPDIEREAAKFAPAAESAGDG